MSEADALPAVVFRIGDLICAAPAARVREVLERLPATRIPGVPFAVEGLVNVRGGLLTVRSPSATIVTSSCWTSMRCWPPWPAAIRNRSEVGSESHGARLR